MLKIGLTGGIGSGKSTVAQVFETLGIPVYYADDAAKRLMNTDKALMQAIQKHFGEASYTDGTLNRKHIASIVFQDQGKLALLNSLTHPATIADAKEWISRQTTPYVIKEAALLFESGSYKDLDYIIGVAAPLPLRLQRVMQRDGISAEEVQQRISRQLNEEEKLKRCNFSIVNDETTAVIPQVLELDQQFREMTRK